MKNYKFPAFASLALVASSHVMATPHSTSTFVHLFEWSWADVANECETFLGPQGYKAVQISPPNEHIAGDQWWTRYQPVSYEIKSRGGNRDQFVDMIKRCKAQGVDIYVDAVINHMAHGNGKSIAGKTYGNKQYPIYEPKDFHKPCAIKSEDYVNDAWRVQNCELVGLHDLDTDSPRVQTKIAGYLNELIKLGVAGFRLDASKHMPAKDIAAILKQLQHSPLVFQEVIDQGGEAITADTYLNNGMVTEFKYSVKLSHVFKKGRLASLKGFEKDWDLMPSDKAIVFTDNHDNQRGHGGAGDIVTFQDGRLYELANVFMLTYPYGYPKVMSSYNFNGDTDAGGPTELVHLSDKLNCNDQLWQCEHRKPSIAGAMRFRAQTGKSQAIQHWWDNGNNQIAFSRGDVGFVAINRGSQVMNVTLQTSLPAGIYCDELSRTSAIDCSGKTVSIDRNGKIHIALKPMDALAIHRFAQVN
ncbi:alpha-amylase [Pseudoalteromonas luteoviolacea]|uniref:Alpha-amylase n=1 Tax=Pseudoalteromonas luteoviolacea (strain 2ta16) TaxID=1353533 RepID=V4H937_PSEL2|nr:alpha-amylase family protein [Pseudoalteromonas luteoviolacea]ESP93971.1 glycosidase [Pseudoalteromonas luteoviolacea 2ta16]KZN33021.1 hypothetical protein N483_26420 [Pseudoalteromonas luteoviolacea NCIMB 1944]